MVVRVRVRLRPLKGRSEEVVETSAIANAGYESISHEIVIPARLARKLGLYPRPPSGARKETFMTAAGKARMLLIPEALEVTVLAGEREEGAIVSTAVISVVERETLLSDTLIGALKLVLLNPGTGQWRFSDDNIETIRVSESVEEW